MMDDTIAVQEPMSCQYRTGKVLGRGSFSVVKEAVHIETGERFACKVISKKLLERREDLVRTEINILSRISSGHPNVVTLHDYFETANNIYLCFDLCTGGHLIERIQRKGKFNEQESAKLVKTICEAIKYIHDRGIIHRDLKPENLLFRSAADDAEIMIADFGLSRMIEEDAMHAIHEVCGTPGYIAPEVYKRRGHGRSVDIWALGIITYFLLSGYIPINSAGSPQELNDHKLGNYSFEPEQYWVNVSPAGKDFIKQCLIVDPGKRRTASELLHHPWFANEKPIEESGGFPALLPTPSPSPANADAGCSTVLPRTESERRQRERHKDWDQHFPNISTNPSFQQDAATVTSILTTFVHEAETEDPTQSEIVHHHRRAFSLEKPRSSVFAQAGSSFACRGLEFAQGDGSSFAQGGSSFAQYGSSFACRGLSDGSSFRSATVDQGYAHSDSNWGSDRTHLRLRLPLDRERSPSLQGGPPSQDQDELTPRYNPDLDHSKVPCISRELAGRLLHRHTS